MSAVTRSDRAPNHFYSETDAASAVRRRIVDTDLPGIELVKSATNLGIYFPRTTVHPGAALSDAPGLRIQLSVCNSHPTLHGSIRRKIHPLCLSNSSTLHFLLCTRCQSMSIYSFIYFSAESSNPKSALMADVIRPSMTSWFW